MANATPTKPAVETSKLLRAYLVSAPALLSFLAIIVVFYALSFDRCQRACVSQGTTDFIHVSGLALGAVLLAAAGLAVAAWHSDSQQCRIARLSMLLAALGVGAWIPYIGLAFTSNISATT